MITMLTHSSRSASAVAVASIKVYVQQEVIIDVGFASQATHSRLPYLIYRGCWDHMQPEKETAVIATRGGKRYFHKFFFIVWGKQYFTV